MRGGLSELHTLELSGPLLPASVVRLLSLLRLSQQGSLRGTFVPSDLPCAHVNVVSSVIQMDSLRNQPDSLGLCKQQQHLARLLKTNLAGKKPIRNVGAFKRIKCADEAVTAEAAKAGKAAFLVELQQVAAHR